MTFIKIIFIIKFILKTFVKIEIKGRFKITTKLLYYYIIINFLTNQKFKNNLIYLLFLTKLQTTNQYYKKNLEFNLKVTYSSFT